MSDALKDKNIGFAMTGSFCTFERVLASLAQLVQTGALVQPILSFAASESDTRFMTARDLTTRLKEITGKTPWTTLQEVEPLGPKRLLDALIIAPCTGNTTAKLANGIADTPVTLAAKSCLRNAKPVVIAISTNDGLSVAAKNIGELLARKHIYFVPFGQDDPKNKPCSLVASMEDISETVIDAMNGKQIQPVLL